MVDPVECRGQVRVQYPPRADRAVASVDDCDRVLAATARPESVTSGCEPGLPFRFQCGATRAWWHGPRSRESRAGALAVARLRYEHPADRRGLERSAVTVHLHRQTIRAGEVNATSPSTPAVADQRCVA